ncbi:MAG: tRNA threonylcarbamoyladenosine dehydratase [Candidatus Omnitrophica bacterium]|nr:tRNA threonylcarbamoyladenosine dehydratase [Candidatus Omnitrophota bacterium]
MGQFFCIELLLGCEKLKKLRDSSVTVIGLGAVGGYCVEALARAGIGRMRLVDFDSIKATNMNRHILALKSTIGRPKALLARKRVLAINPLCEAEALNIFASEETLDAILGNNPDLVIDAIDSLNPKAQLLKACRKKGIPVISSMGAATRTDPLAVRIGDLFDTTHCPLAKRLRMKLKKEDIGRGITCVYSAERRNLSAIGEDSLSGEDDYRRGRKRSKLGSLPTITAIFGLTIAHKAIEILCGGFDK